MNLRYFIIEFPNGNRYKIVISNEDSSTKTNVSPLDSEKQLETNDPKDLKDLSVSTLVNDITNSPQNPLTSENDVSSSSGKSPGQSAVISRNTSIGGTRVSKKRRKYKKTIKKKHKKITKKQKKRKQNNSIK